MQCVLAHNRSTDLCTLVSISTLTDRARAPAWQTVPSWLTFSPIESSDSQLSVNFRFCILTIIEILSMKVLSTAVNSFFWWGFPHRQQFNAISTVSCLHISTLVYLYFTWHFSSVSNISIWWSCIELAGDCRCYLEAFKVKDCNREIFKWLQTEFWPSAHRICSAIRTVRDNTSVVPRTALAGYDYPLNVLWVYHLRSTWLTW